MSADPVQKLKIRNGAVFGLTGNGALFDPMIQWYIDGANPEALPKCAEAYADTALIVFRQGHACFYKVNLPYPDDAAAPDAWGAGADFAIGAMEAGASAEQAVELAIRREAYCGGPVQVIDTEGCDVLGHEIVTNGISPHSTQRSGYCTRCKGEFKA
jgi:hypothetical protein